MREIITSNKSDLKKNKTLQKIIVWAFVTLIVVGGLVTSRVHYEIGNIFFGRFSMLYNVSLSQRIFTSSAYPLIGRSTKFAHYQLSRTYFIQGRFDEALSEAQKELELYPENTRTYYILGLTYGYMYREVEAIDSFSKFIEANPFSWAARNDKAWLQFRAGDISGALETMEPVAGVLNPWVQNTYGTLLMNAGRQDEAKLALTRANELVSQMAEEHWGSAYPGNDPRIYQIGLRSMKESIESNLKLLN